MTKPRLMFVSCSDYDALRAKGVSKMLLDRAEDGYFSRVLSLHPLARKNRIISIGPNNDLVELGFDVLPGASRFKFLRFFFASFFILRAIIVAPRLAMLEQINIVRASDPFYAGLIGWITAKIMGIPFCISLHADYERRENCDLIARLPFAFVFAKFILRHADVVAPISDYLAEKVQGYGVDISKICVIQHGVDMSLFDGVRQKGIRKLFNLSDDTRIVLYVNRLSNQKFCWDALEIARKINSENVVTLFCGDGPERNAMEVLVAKDPSFSSRVRFLGFQSRELIAALAAEADVGLVLLAGFGLIEMCAAGLPVVVYGMEWQQELVKQGYNGIIIAEGDTNSAANAVEELLSDQKFAQSLGAAARVSALKKFSLESARSRRINLYNATFKYFFRFKSPIQ